MIRLRASIPALCSALALSVTACGNTDTGGVDTMPSGSSTAISPSGTTTSAVSPGSVGPVGNTSTAPTNQTSGSGASGNTSTGGGSGSNGGSGTTTTTAPSSGVNPTSTGPVGTTTTSPTSTAPTSGDPTSTGGEQTTSGGEVTTEPTGPEPTLVTSAQNAYWTVGEATEGSGNATLTVNDGQVQADWIGWGGTFNERGWYALLKLNEADRAKAIQLLFSKNDGAAFTFGRIPIGSSDYGLDNEIDQNEEGLKDYTLNESANDYEMANFTIERDKKYLIPYIKAAIGVNPDIKFWGSPWTPPTWMKDNGAFDKGNIKNDPQTLQAHALYLAKFVEKFGEEGIKIFAVQPQNEPGYVQDYPSCGWSASVMTDYVGNYLGPLFDEMGLEAEIWLGTLSNSSADHSIGTSVMGNGTAMGYVKGFGLQWGMINNVASYVGKGVPVMQTEHMCGNYPFSGAPVVGSSASTNQNVAPNDYAYGKETWTLIKTWLDAKVNSYSAWNMVLDTGGRNTDKGRPWAQNALLTVDQAQGKLNITPAYYVFRHFSQYVEPGAKRVSVSGSDAFAFKNPDNSVVTIVYNSGGQAAQHTLSAAGKTVSFSVPGGGWATVNLQAE